jgi:hypothetical protein
MDPAEVEQKTTPKVWSTFGLGTATLVEDTLQRGAARQIGRSYDGFHSFSETGKAFSAGRSDCMPTAAPAGQAA